jgi:Fe-S-cluster-containing dehydrogenase component
MSRRADAYVVACLGGISEQALLKFVAEGGRKLVIMDRKWCEACAAGRRAAPWQDAVDKVQSLLGEMGRAIDPRIEDLRIKVIAEPLPAAVSLPLVSVGAHAANMSRRQIFVRIFSPPPAIPAAGDADRCVAPHTVMTTALTNRSALLLRINADEPLPGSLFPAISLRESCCGNLMCATTCPTAALASAKNGVTASLLFDAALCINCGSCSAICPTGSLELRARGDDCHAGRFELRRHARAFCEICDSEFNPDGEDARCPACRVDRGLAAAGFGLMRRNNQAVLDL